MVNRPSFGCKDVELICWIFSSNFSICISMDSIEASYCDLQRFVSSIGNMDLILSHLQLTVDFKAIIDLFLTFMLKFIYSDKATKFCEISTVDLSYVVPVKSTVEISQNFVTFSEYMKFNQMFSAKAAL